MKKRILSVAATLLVLLAFALPASAEYASQETYVLDMADLLSAEEETAIYNSIVDFIRETDIHIMIITDTIIHTEDYIIWGYTSDLPTSDYIVLAVSSVNDAYYYNLFTYGRAYLGLSDSEVDAILDDTSVYDNLKGGNISEGVLSFIEVTRGYAKEIPPASEPAGVSSPDTYNDNSSRFDLNILPTAIIAAVAIASLCCGIVVARYKMKIKPTNYPLDRFARLELTERQDIFVGSFVTKHRINTGNSGGKGGGSRTGGGSRMGGGGRVGGHRGGR